MPSGEMSVDMSGGASRVSYVEPSRDVGGSSTSKDVRAPHATRTVDPNTAKPAAFATLRALGDLMIAA